MHDFKVKPFVGVGPVRFKQYHNLRPLGSVQEEVIGRI